MNMQHADASPRRQDRQLAKGQVQHLRPAFATTAKIAKKCSTATPGFAARPRLPSLPEPAIRALLLGGVVIALALKPAIVLANPGKACRFADDAPDQHLVVRGDSLWDLASRFLRDPWCWPRVWEDNHDAVRNPHLIYPGQQIRLDRAHGRLTSADDAQALPVVRMTPAMHAESIPVTPIPLIASSWLALLQRTPLMSEAELAQAARIVALPAERRMAGAGDVVYARGKSADAPRHSLSTELRRPLAPVVDPDTGVQIALPTRRVGRASRVRNTSDGLQAMRITEAHEEVMAGDLLVATRDPDAVGRALVPHAAANMQGRVAAILHDGRWATLHDAVVLNRGSQHGLDAGSVVEVVRPVKIGAHESAQASQPATDLDESVATLLVVEVLNHAALAIVMRAQEPFTRGAPIASPDGASR